MANSVKNDVTLGVLGMIVRNSVSVMERPVIRPLDSVSVHWERQENTARKFVTAGFMVQAVLSCVSVHTEASVTSALVTAHVLSPGWDPPVRKVLL